MGTKSHRMLVNCALNYHIATILSVPLCCVLGQRSALYKVILFTHHNHSLK